ncbi:hypothetical protein [Pantoea stewartii]|uniref:Uncharacterized protein n=1 Tax=Pantoea stewartii subsp. stewartii DC283 TaxID=660596 RepID=A0ABN4Z0S7_PANSE|nr:hypothetical protein [Pantoea stewartii]ARF50003.1 hypothetical protein DSJ_12050 [Pantoea stewartii subsp. stewartii DC283]
MAFIVFKRRKENSKSRRMRERGEHYAATKAQCDADRLTARKIESAFSRLTGEPVARVCKALSCTDYKMNLRVKPVPEAVTRENPEYRKVKNPFGQITNARQRIRGKSIPAYFD